MADDIQRYLSDEPIMASPPSNAYRLRKFVRRNRAGVTAGAVMVLAMIVSTMVSIAFALSESTQRNLAQENLALAELRQEETLVAVDQLEQVVDFQSSMLTRIDAHSSFEVPGRSRMTTELELQRREQAQPFAPHGIVGHRLLQGSERF